MHSASLDCTELYHTALNCTIVHGAAHSRFRGSVNCGDPLIENRFKVANFLCEVQEASSVFLSGPKWPRGHLGSLYWLKRAF